MTLFVTGGTGFIGGHFIDLAIAKGHTVFACRRKGSQSRIRLNNSPGWVEGDLESSFDEVLKNCDGFVHFAAAGVLPSQASWEECLRWNVSATHKLLRAAVDAGVSRFILCGSCFEYGRVGEHVEFIPTTAPLQPIGAYAASKAAATMAAMGLATEKALRMAVLRPFHVFGKGEHASRLWPSLHSAAMSNKDFLMTKGEQILDFTPVEFAARTFLSVLEQESLDPGITRLLNIGTGRPQTVRSFAEHWWAKWGAKGKLKIGALPYRHNEVMRYVPALYPSSRAIV